MFRDLVEPENPSADDGDESPGGYRGRDDAGYREADGNEPGDVPEVIKRRPGVSLGRGGIHEGHYKYSPSCTLTTRQSARLSRSHSGGM